MMERFSGERSQSGAMLLEALIAILVFSMGILALVGLQATAVQQSTDAKYRSEAALLANEVIAEMWVSNRAASVLESNFKTGGGAFSAWEARVASVLPGVVTGTATAPDIAVGSDGSVTVIVRWAAPNEPATVHQYVSVAQIR